MPAPVFAAMAAGGALIGMLGQQSAAKQMKRAARAQANLILETGREQMRRTELQHEHMLGTAEAAGYASGLKMDARGSTARYRPYRRPVEPHVARSAGAGPVFRR